MRRPPMSKVGISSQPLGSAKRSPPEKLRAPTTHKPGVMDLFKTYQTRQILNALSTSMSWTN